MLAPEAPQIHRIMLPAAGFFVEQTSSLAPAQARTLVLRKNPHAGRIFTPRPAISSGGECGGSAGRSGGPRRGRTATDAARRHDGSTATAPRPRDDTLPPRASPVRSGRAA